MWNSTLAFLLCAPLAAYVVVLGIYRGLQHLHSPLFAADVELQSSLALWRSSLELDWQVSLSDLASKPAAIRQGGTVMEARCTSLLDVEQTTA